jgi:hypothetical protein
MTGADLGKIQGVTGAFSRYGGEENASAIAYAGLRSQNMQNGQFNEFLSGMERILEEGIEKGFIRGSEEIAGNMAMLYKLSGDSPLWQGEQGAQRLSQMNASISSATALQTPAHDIVYSVAKNMLLKDDPSTPEVETRKQNFYRLMGLDPKKESDQIYTGTYLDNFALIERAGANGKMMGGIRDMVRGFESGNVAGQIEFYKQIYGLNNTGAMQLYNMFANASTEDLNDEKWQAMVQKEIIDNPGNKSDSAKLQDILNDLNKNIVEIGQIEFNNTELPLIYRAVEDIKEELAERNGGNLPPAPSPSQVIDRTTSDADRAASSNRYFAGAEIPGLDPALKAVQDEYNALLNQYAHGDIGIEQYLGNAGSMGSYRQLWDAATYNKKADPGETDDLRDALRALSDDFRAMMRNYRPPDGKDVSVILPDTINVYEMS